MPQELRWLWPGLIPRGKLTVIAGDPGLGKSFVTLDMCAAASRGGPFPGAEGEEPGEPIASIILSAEDDPADTIRPRLERMNARLSRITLLDGFVDPHERVFDFVLGEHVAELRELIRSTDGIGLLIVDPISAYVGGVDSYNNAQVRSMLKPLSDLAADENVAVVLVTHLRKSEASKVLHKAMGSLAFTAAARVVLVVARDQQDPEVRLLLTAKSNLAEERIGFSYKVEQGRVVWCETLEGTADEILAGRAGAPRKDYPEFTDALRRAIGQGGGRFPVSEARSLANQMRVPLSVLRRPAWRQAAGITTVKEGSDWYLITGASSGDS